MVAPPKGTGDGLVAEFFANRLPDKIDDASTPIGEIWGNNGLFEIQHTWDDVRLTNYSDRDMITNLIDVYNRGSSTIDIDVENVPGPTDSPASTRLAPCSRIPV